MMRLAAFQRSIGTRHARLVEQAKFHAAHSRLPTRTITSRPPPSHRPLRQQVDGLTLRPGGLPEWLELWGPKPFKRMGVALTATSAAALAAAATSVIAPLPPLLLALTTALYWRIGLSDLRAKYHTLRRNFPVIIHLRYLLEGIRPEIQQYLIEDEFVAAPFSRAMRNTVYQNAKARSSKQGFGTRRDVYAQDHEWAAHSLWPAPVQPASEARVLVGGPFCTAPYRASLLNISAMSFGSLSSAAVSALAGGAAKGGFYLNTGEGGISRYHLQEGNDLVWNVGTGYFACGSSSGANGERLFDAEQFRENATRPEVKMVEVKLSQGAKPAHGGILPAVKITPAIAEARGLGPPPWTLDVVSPPRHSAFSSPAELMAFVQRLRELSGGKPVGIKLCVGRPSEIAALCHAMLATELTPDFITVDGAEGGTGAAPSEFQDSLGMPMRDGLQVVHSLLVGCGLRDQVRLICSGKVYNGFSLVSNLAHGADFCNSARSMMFALGCIQSLKCNTNKCPTGVTTNDPVLMRGLDVPSKAERVFNFHAATVASSLEILAALGVSKVSEVTPEMLYRRVGDHAFESLAEAQRRSSVPTLEAGVLLGLGGSDGDERAGAVPQLLHDWWEEGRKIHEGTARASRGERGARV